MVRGKEDCKDFCQNCRQDCRCACGRCHFCVSREVSLATVRNRGTQVISAYQHYRHEHDCLGGAVKASTKDDKKDDKSEARAASLGNISNIIESDIYTITVVSDNEKKTFFIYKGALTKHSGYFKGLFNFNHKTERDNVRLMEKVDKPSAFGLFAQFVYVQDYNVSPGSCCIQQHAEVYVLADRLGAAAPKSLALKNATQVCVVLSLSVGSDAKGKGKSVKAMTQQFKDTTINENTSGLGSIPDIIRFVYENTPANTTLPEPPNEPSVAKTGGSAPMKGRPRPSATLKDTKPGPGKTTRPPKRKFEEIAAAEPTEIPGIKQDGFRRLLSKFSARCLNELNKIDDFVACLADTPEFWQDLLGNLTQAGPLQVDAQGSLI